MIGFQTPDVVCDLMVSMIEGNPNVILEPTPGQGNLVRAIKKRFPNAKILAPKDIFSFNPDCDIDWIISNPPFSPMIRGFEFLQMFKQWTNNIIILLPWNLLINSRIRTKWFYDNGVCEIHHLPRSVFKGSRVQTCIVKMTNAKRRFTKLYLKNTLAPYLS